jgi:hypothetical protein
MDCRRQLRFCLPVNLARYFAWQGVPLWDWQLLLAMKAIGFQYFGLEQRRVEVLNGLSGASTDMLSNVVSCFGCRLRTMDVEMQALQPWDGKYLLVTDDYFLPYNCFYQRKHNLRFVVAEAREDKSCIIFDGVRRALDCRELTPAVVSVLRLECDARAVLPGRVDRLLLAQWRAERQEHPPLYVKQIAAFAQDVQGRRDQCDRSLLETLHFCVNRPAGPVVTRHEMGKALAVLGGRCRESGCRDRAEAFLHLSDQWRIIGNLFFKVSCLGNAKVFDRIHERILDVIQLEKEAAL